MSTVEILETITDWVRKEICANVKLKMPNDDKVDKNYNQVYELVNPAVFTMFMPGYNRLPAHAKRPIPSITVQLESGSDSLNEGKGQARINLQFSVWDPGLHGKDKFFPNKDRDVYHQLDGQELLDLYERNSEGWRDVWNFIDTALRKIESAEYIGFGDNKYRILKEDGIEYGPATEEKAVVDFYPYWYAWISFSVQYGLTRNNQDIQKFL